SKMLLKIVRSGRLGRGCLFARSHHDGILSRTRARAYVGIRFVKNLFKIDDPIRKEAIRPQLDIRPHDLNGVKVVLAVVRGDADNPYVRPVNFELRPKGSSGQQFESRPYDHESMKDRRGSG